VSRANRMAAKVQSGIIWVNCWLLRDLRTPFGGFKNSGVGREGGLDALRFSSRRPSNSFKLVAIAFILSISVFFSFDSFSWS
jgi:aminomuconate-semialdehyde/2-hydroxymuconate-6-semialdehyde dehydrogenase